MVWPNWSKRQPTNKRYLACNNMRNIDQKYWWREIEKKLYKAQTLTNTCAHGLGSIIVSQISLFRALALLLCEDVCLSFSYCLRISVIAYVTYLVGGSMDPTLLVLVETGNDKIHTNLLSLLRMISTLNAKNGNFLSPNTHTKQQLCNNHYTIYVFFIQFFL